MNVTLQRELIQRGRKNQQLRLKNAKSYQQWLQIISADQDNSSWLKQIVGKVGWPTLSMVGYEAARAARQIVQHSGDSLFMKRCLRLMEPLVKSGEVSYKEFAILTDIYLVGQGKKQLYGTQGKNHNGRVVPWPIQDEKRVDERREAAGLRPLAEHFNAINLLNNSSPLRQ